MNGFGITRSIPMLCEAREKKRGHNWSIELLIFLLVFLIGSILESIPVTIGTCIWLFGQENIMGIAIESAANNDMSAYFDKISDIASNMPSWIMIVTLFATVLLTLTCIFFCRWVEKRRVPSMGLRRHNAVMEYIVGALMGIVLVALSIILCVFTGGIAEVNLKQFDIGLLALYLIGYMIQGMSEEVACRGYLMVSMTRRNPVWLSVILSSAMFSLLHIANPGFGLMPFVNIFLTGLVFGVYVLKRGNLWGACAMHSFWNFFVGNVFGISVSGTKLSENTTILQTAVGGGADLWTGGEFGLEGSLCVTIVMIAALAIELFVMPAADDGRFDAPVPASDAEFGTPAQDIIAE